MNHMHLHLLASHAPLMLCALALVAIQAGIWRSRPDWTRAGLWLTMVSAVAAAFAVLTGHAAKDVAIALGAPARLVELHQRRGDATFALMAFAGFAASQALRRSRAGQTSPRWTSIAAFTVLVALVMLIRTSWFGGIIRHAEITAGWGEYR